MQKPLLLLVEDEEDDAFFFKRALAKSGVEFVIHHALNGAIAIDFLRNAASSDSLPKVIFLDLKMPVLNGFDVLSWLQHQPFFTTVPVIVLSGSEQQKDIDRAVELRAFDYLVKPIQVEDFVRVVQNISASAGTPVEAAAGAKP